MIKIHENLYDIFLSGRYAARYKFMTAATFPNATARAVTGHVVPKRVRPIRYHFVPITPSPCYLGALIFPHFAASVKYPQDSDHLLWLLYKHQPVMLYASPPGCIMMSGFAWIVFLLIFLGPSCPYLYLQNHRVYRERVSCVFTKKLLVSIWSLLKQ